MRSLLTTIYFLAARLLRQPRYMSRRCRVALNSRIELGCVLVDTVVGPYTYLGASVHLNTTRVGNYCSIAAGAKVGGMEHSWWWGSTSPRISAKNIHGRTTEIEDDVWVGSNAVIRQGVKVGRGAVIGAGAVVLADVAPYSIVAGVPAKLIRQRFADDLVRQVEATRFWEQTPRRARALLDAIDFPDTPVT